MGLGSSSKGGGGGGGKRGRAAYGMMLLVAFGAAVLGVMVLHRLRERRIFNLLIQDKDHHLFSLNLLLQKERDSTKEVKRKIEELKAKTYSLRTQKMELRNKLMEMQSITASLKEERRALESALEDKWNEIKFFKEKEINSSREKSQVIALTVLLKQKEAEIEVMKSRLEKPTNISSVSMVDPSNSLVNITRAEVFWGNKDKQSLGSVNANDAETRMTGEGGSGRATERTDQKEIPGEGRWQKIENDQDGEGLRESGETGEKNAEEGQVRGEVSGDKFEKSEDHQDDEGFGARGEKNNRNTTEVIESSKNDEVIKTKDGSSDTKEMAGEEHGISRNEQSRKLENTRDGEGRLLGVISKDGMPLERHDGSRNVVGPRVRGEYGYRSIKNRNRRGIISRDRKLKKTGNSEGVDVSVGGKRWRVNEGGDRTAVIDDKMGEDSRDEKFKMFENSKYNEGSRTRSDSGDRVDLKGKDERVISNGGRLKMPEISKESPYPQDAENLRMKVLSTDSNPHARKEDETVSKYRQLEKLQNSQDGEGLEVSGINGKSGGLAIEAIEQKLDEEIRQPEDQEVRGAFDIKHSGSEGTKDTNGKEEPENLEVDPEKTDADDETNYKLKEDEEDDKANTEEAKY